VENLVAVLDHPAARERIVSLHGYHAYDEVVEILTDHPTPGAIYHWFMGNPDTLRRTIALDIFYSINQNMLSLQAGRGVIAALPRNRVLIETDAPYIDLITGRPRTVRTSPGQPGWTMTLDQHGRRIPDDPDEVSEALLPGKVSTAEVGLACLWDVTLSEVREQMWTNMAELESRVTRRPFNAVGRF
jgi:Tat protein secretion system quality control protein TatD with DNase activity